MGKSPIKSIKNPKDLPKDLVTQEIAKQISENLSEIELPIIKVLTIVDTLEKSSNGLFLTIIEYLKELVKRKMIPVPLLNQLKRELENLLLEQNKIHSQTKNMIRRLNKLTKKGDDVNEPF